MRLQSAIFDMDGTLIDSMPAWRRLGADVVRSFGAEPEADLRASLKSLTMREQASYCRERYRLPQTVEEVTAAFAARMEDFYRNRAEAKPGVKRALSLLKMEGVWMYVATATDRELTEAALRRAGIREYFRGIVTCPEVGRGKEYPDVYLRAMARLQSNLKDTVIFEDALHAIKTAKNAGFRVAAVYDIDAADQQEEIKHLADYYFVTLEELFEVKAP